MAKKNEDAVKTEIRFTRDQITASDKYKNRADLLNVLLDEEKQYSLSEVDDLMTDYYEKEV